MKTYFIRHTLSCSISSEFRSRLWRERKIAVHYEDKRSTNPKDYPPGSAHRALKLMNEIADHGGFICATYHGAPGCLVGRVNPTSKILIEVGPKPPDQSGDSILKALQLENARIVPPEIANRLLIGQPQQRTISPWHIIGDRIQQFIETGKLQLTKLGDLLPFEQEVMCAEFLRTKTAEQAGLPRLAHLAAPVGGTREVVDIAGITAAGRTILAQVTHHEGSEPQTIDKLAALHGVGTGGNAHMILFCRKVPATISAANVHLFPLETVFDEMAKLPAWCAAIGMN
jgi:hypothetical protein